MEVDGGFLDKVNNKDITLLKNKPDEFWEGVEHVAGMAFHNCKNILTSIYIPSSVIGLSTWAFAHCENLREVTISYNIKYVGHSLFLGCNKLEKVVFENVKNIKDSLENALKGFDFDSFIKNGDEVTLIRNTQNTVDEERE